MFGKTQGLRTTPRARDRTHWRRYAVRRRRQSIRMPVGPVQLLQRRPQIVSGARSLSHLPYEFEDCRRNVAHEKEAAAVPDRFTTPKLHSGHIARVPVPVAGLQPEIRKSLRILWPFAATLSVRLVIGAEISARHYECAPNEMRLGCVQENVRFAGAVRGSCAKSFAGKTVCVSELWFGLQIVQQVLQALPTTIGEQ